MCYFSYALICIKNRLYFYKCFLSFATFSDTLCLTGDTSGSQDCFSPTPSSSVADVPMQTSELLESIESCRTIAMNRRKYLDLDLFKYDFSTEISVLNDINNYEP